MKIPASCILSLILTFSTGACYALDCSERLTMSYLKDDDASTRIKGIACFETLKAPSVSTVMRLVELFGDESRGSTKASILSGLGFDKQKEYSEQVDYHAVRAKIPLNPEYIEPLLSIVGRSTSKTARQVEAALLRKFAFGGYRSQVVDGLRRVIPRDPKATNRRELGGGFSVTSTTAGDSLNGVPEGFWEYQFALDEVGNDRKFSARILDTRVSDDSPLAQNWEKEAPYKAGGRTLISATEMQAALAVIEATGNFEYVISIANMIKRTQLSHAMGMPVLQRLGKGTLETPDEWIKWAVDKRNFNAEQRPKFKGPSSNEAYTAWLATSNGKAADEAAAVLNERNTLISAGHLTLFAPKENRASPDDASAQKAAATQADADFINSPKAMSFTLLSASAGSSGLALLSAEGTSFSQQRSSGGKFGNTSCHQRLPIACISKQAPPNDKNYWNGALEVPAVKLTQAVLGTSMSTFDAGDGVCSAQFGADWKMLGEEHATIRTGVPPSALVVASIAPATRFWVKAGSSRVRTAFCNVAPPPLSAAAKPVAPQ
jgi:hypothetical protein